MAFYCVKCQYMAESMSDAINHSMTRHGKESSAPPAPKPSFICPCRKVFHSRNGLMYHLTMHHDIVAQRWVINNYLLLLTYEI